jgi:hypothetical protein
MYASWTGISRSTARNRATSPAKNVHVNYWMRQTQQTSFDVAVSQMNKQMHRPEELVIRHIYLVVCALERQSNDSGLHSVRFEGKRGTAQASRGFRLRLRRATIGASGPGGSRGSDLERSCASSSGYSVAPYTQSQPRRYVSLYPAE